MNILVRFFRQHPCFSVIVIAVASLVFTIVLTIGIIQARQERAATQASDDGFRVGIQVGHWKNNELPEELDNLIGNLGASEAGVHEVDVNRRVAEIIAEKLRPYDIEVDILPATVPENYKADAFIAIHADGSTGNDARGYKIAGSQFDLAGESARLSDAIERSYGDVTGLPLDSHITFRMTRYYAFNYLRFNHSIDSTTPGVIVELGFITNTEDRNFLTRSPERAAQGVADGVLQYLGKQ